MTKMELLNPSIKCPFFIASPGRDYFTPEQNLAFIRKAELIEKQSGITISHEIHRGRFSYSAVQIGYYLDRVPSLRLSADFSHWCVVSESLLENFEDVIS